MTPLGRKMTLARRRQINPYRQLTVEVLDLERALLRFTCKRCQHAWDEVLKSPVTGKPMTTSQVKFLTNLWTKAYGSTTGHCPRCTKAARDEVAPL